jgi:hypothetical protein
MMLARSSTRTTGGVDDIPSVGRAAPSEESGGGGRSPPILLADDDEVDET